jgi:hypothetical protein
MVMNAATLHTALIALDVCLWLAGFAVLANWALDQGDHRYIVEAVHLGDDRYRIEYEWSHRGVWFGGWVVGSAGDWHHEATVSRVHPVVGAWLCRMHGALERQRRRPLHLMENEREPSEHETETPGSSGYALVEEVDSDDWSHGRPRVVVGPRVIG